MNKKIKKECVDFFLSCNKYDKLIVDKDTESYNIHIQSDNLHLS